MPLTLSQIQTWNTVALIVIAAVVALICDFLQLKDYRLREWAAGHKLRDEEPKANPSIATPAVPASPVKMRAAAPEALAVMERAAQRAVT